MSFKIHEIGRKFGQRDYSRLFIPGATVSWKSSGQDSLSEDKCPLSDISIGGLAFLTNNPPVVKSEIVLMLWVPQKTEAFELLGEVKYSVTRGPRLTYKYRVGVRFRPFDQADGCNSLEALDQIKELDRIFGERHFKK
jgi:hypothetical protein